MMPSIAEDIATLILTRLDTEGVPVPDTLRSNMPGVVQLFIALSRPIRASIRAFLVAQEAQLRTAFATALSYSRRADVLAEKIALLESIATSILTPVDNALRAMPLDSVVKQSPDLAQFLTELANSMPIKIPLTGATALAGIGGFDFFEGITNYRDLRAKIDELVFRAARAAAFSTYASASNNVVRNQLDKIRVYLEIIDSLDLAIKNILIAPLSLYFGTVSIGSISVLEIVVSNESTGLLSCSSFVVGPEFVIVKGQGAFILSSNGSERTLAVRFVPIAIGLVAGTLSITHNATNLSSPLVVALSGLGA